MKEKKEESNNSSSSIEKRKSKLRKFFFGWIKDNYDKTFLIILLIAFAIRLYIFFQTMDQPLWWDAADYLATAKRWAGLNPNLIDMWYYRRGFLWPLIGAFFFKLNLGETGIRFLMTLFSTGIIFVSYHLIKKMFNKKLAILTSIGLTASWIYLFFTGRLLTNLPATFFLLTFLFLFWKGYVLKEGNKFLYLSAIFFALSVLTRMQYIMFIIPILFLVFSREKFKFFLNKKLWITLGIFLLILIPQMVIHYQHFGNPLADLTKYYLGVGSSQSEEVGVSLTKTSNLFLYFNNLPYILDGNQQGYSSLFTFSPVYILFIIGIFLFFADLFLGFDKIFKNEELQKKLFIFIWIISTFLFLGYIAPQLEQRYIMQTLPFLFLIASYSVIKIGIFIRQKLKTKNKTFFIIFLIIFILLLTPNLFFGNKLINEKLTSYIEIKQAGEWIKANSNPEDIVISDSLSQITYYSERSTYPFDLAYRRDISHGNETDFYEFVESEKPRYMILSIFEQSAEWAYSYPQSNFEKITLVQSYNQGNQPVLGIYEFN